MTEKDWIIQYDKKEVGKRSYGQESLMSLGNGYLGLRGAPLWSTCSDNHYPGLYVAGVFNRTSTEVAGHDVINEDMVNWPNPQLIKVYIDGELVDFEASVEKQATIDFKNALQIERYQVKLAKGNLTLVTTKFVDPINFHDFGFVGEIIADAVKRGCRHFLIGIGGSATNDGGIGMLQALGFGMLDENGNQVEFGAKGLRQLKSITTSHVLPELSKCIFRVACDVTNPLCGSTGCSAVFGPQKGADSEMINMMDRWLKDYALLSRKYFPDVNESLSGAGAAGGLGFAFLTFLHATLESGIKIVLEETKLRDYVQNADIVVTGEGRLDGQTVMGKAPIGVAKIAKEYGKPVIAFSGCVTKDAIACNEHGIDAFFPVLRSVSTLDEAMCRTNAMQNIEDTAEQVFRLIRTFSH